MRGLVAAALALSLCAYPIGARGLVWPDTAERIEQGLSAPDPVARRAAAGDLVKLHGPRGALLVRRGLGDDDVEVRLAAAHAAIGLRVDGATDDVLSWLSERDARVRIAACEVAQAMPSARAVPLLARALADAEPLVRTACADALGASGLTEAVSPLSGKLDDPTPNVRVQVARALARLGDARAVVPLVGKVHDSAVEVRQAVVQALGELGDTRASQALILALRDNAVEVRTDALSALGRLRAVDAVDAIAPMASERSPNLRAAALHALGRIGSPSAVRVLIGTLGSYEDRTATVEPTPVRTALVSAGNTAVSELTKLLARPVSSAVLTSAVWVLGELHASASASAVVNALRNGTLPTAPALHALARIGTSAELPVVLEFVADPNAVVRDAALGAVDALFDTTHPDGRAVEPLIAALRTARLSVRERAFIATLLGKTGAPRATSELIGLLGAKDHALRLAAVSALGALGNHGGTRAVDDALLPLLADADPAMRLSASIAIGAAGGVAARQALLDKLAGIDELDRFALFGALGGILERHPDEPAVRRAFEELAVAVGPERDAIITSAGRARIQAAASALIELSKATLGADRKSALRTLAAHPDAPLPLETVRAGLGDPDPQVRAEAAFSLGALGNASESALLVDLVRSGSHDVATNAAGALARIAIRASYTEKNPSTFDALKRASCAVVADGRPTVRANALVALAAIRQRCSDGLLERRLLIDDASALVRQSAARTLAAAPGPDDRAALERCAASDRSPEVARRCRIEPAPFWITKPRAVTLFVMSDSGPKRALPHAPFLLEYGDGVLRAGMTDRRGAVFDPVAPDGALVLHEPNR